jgi:hypothetical protein
MRSHPRVECLCHQSLRPQRLIGIDPIKTVALPTYQMLIDDVIRSELYDGWLIRCQEQEIYLELNRELVRNLASVLKKITDQTVLEVCAGRGELARVLDSLGTQVLATDKASAPDLSIDKALHLCKSNVVLGCFVPYDSGVDEMVLANSNVEHYIVLNARIGGQLGSDLLWNHPQWKVEPIERVTQWMITRHDVWLGKGQKILTHGEAWHLSRR